MHSLFKKADELSRVAIGAAIEVHRLKGPGLIRRESGTISSASGWVMSSSFQLPKHLRGWSKTPSAYRVLYKDFRRVFVERFPYKIFYQLRGNNVIVFRVLHHARDYPAQL